MTTASKREGSSGLPLFVGARNRHAAAALIFVVGTAIYLVTNRFHFGSPRLLPLTRIDSDIPFVPNTVWIYNSDYLYFVAVYCLLCPDLETLNKYCFSFLSLIVASGLIFMCWPTAYPRDRFPLPGDLGAATAGVFNLLRRADTPANCCPSLHVSGVYLSWFALFDGRKRARSAFFFVWATLIVLSTLTTKQHYLIDVICGFGMALLFYWLFHRLAPYRRISKTDDEALAQRRPA